MNMILDSISLWRSRPGCGVQARRLHHNSGFTLTEVLVAAALLGIGLIPLAYIQSSGTRNGVASNGLVVASALAIQLTDEIVNIPFIDTRLNATTAYVAPDATLSDANPLAANGTYSSACGSSNCGYTRTWKITADTPSKFMKRIDVQVSWNEYGVTRTFTLSTIKAE